MTLAWRSLAAVNDDYTVFVHVPDGAGQIAAQADVVYPTSFWMPGEYVTDTYSFQLPPGQYSLATGLYNLETGERLPLSNGQGDRLQFTPLTFHNVSTFPAWCFRSRRLQSTLC